MESPQYIIMFDPTKCMGCGNCQFYCAVEHSRSKMVYEVVFETPRPKYFTHNVLVDVYVAPLRCFHCDKAPCMQVCPTKAIYRDEATGFVVVKPDVCIGCKACTMVCPFGIPTYDYNLRTMIKCDGCVERVKMGKKPACVEACKSGALKFGTIEELQKEKMLERAKEVITGAALAAGVVMLPPVKIPPPPKPPATLETVLSMYKAVRYY